MQMILKYEQNDVLYCNITGVIVTMFFHSILMVHLHPLLQSAKQFDWQLLLTHTNVTEPKSKLYFLVQNVLSVTKL